MYCYLHDAFLRDHRYESQINKIENRLAELGLQGKTERLTILKNMREIVQDAIKKGVDTIVAVGDDSTISKLLSLIAEKNITLGIIPMGPKQSITQMLGIPGGPAACDTLSKRIVKRLDLGKINGHYFLRSLEISKSNVMLESDRGYQISAVAGENEIRITNLPASSQEIGDSNPEDGFLEAIVQPTKQRGFLPMFRRQFSRASVFPLRRVRITCSNECVPLLVDNETVIKTPAAVEIAPGSLRVIVGAKRFF
ncbi:MAG: diacylglycerol kinase family protein [bacterium]